MAKSSSKKEQLTVSFSYQNLVWLLVALNVLTVFLWKPWEKTTVSDRTITVSGEATIESEPDLFQFSPQYELTDSDKDKVLEKATDKANEVINGLKALGVEEKDLKLNSSSYDNWWYDQDNETNRAYVNISVKTTDKEFAQEIQDFLLATTPEGQITPWPSFSEEKQDSLETEARTLAIADAKAKAEQSASELGAKVGSVVSVSEGSGFGGFPVYALEDTAISSNESRSSLPILPGENEFNFSVTVVFELK